VVTGSRAIWRAFREQIEQRPSLDDTELRDLLARLQAQPDRWLERACVVTLVRGERELLSDDQLRDIAAAYGGKIAAFVATVLERRATSRERARSER
jgi:hypothetical protein